MSHKFNIKNESDRVYIDILKASSSSDKNASFFKTYGENIIEKSNEYYLAIDRFSIPCNNIPLIIFNPTTNFYTVEMEYSGTLSGSVSLTYIPSNMGITPSYSSYYNIYAFDIMMSMINTAISTAFTQLAALIALPAGSVAPWFSINEVNHLIQYWAQYNTYDTMTLANPIKLYMNDELYKFFYGMPIYFNRFSVSLRAQFLSFNLYNNVLTSVPPVGPGIICHVMHSNRGLGTLTDWNVCRGILMTSDHIQTFQESLPSKSNDLLNKRNILANFDFIYSNEHPAPDQAQYILNSVYKLIDLVDSRPVKIVDINIYWYDIYNNIYRLTMQEGKALSIRLVFIKKHTNN